MLEWPSHFTVKIETLDEALWSWSIKTESQFGLTHGSERTAIFTCYNIVFTKGVLGRTETERENQKWKF